MSAVERAQIALNGTMPGFVRVRAVHCPAPAHCAVLGRNGVCWRPLSSFFSVSFIFVRGGWGDDGNPTRASHWLRPQGPKISIPAWAFCMSSCAQFEFRVTQEGDKPAPREPVGPPPQRDIRGNWVEAPAEDEENIVSEVVTVSTSCIGMIIGKV